MSSSSSTKRKRAPKCFNCLVENPDHTYHNCKEPCNICHRNDHKTRSCTYYKIKDRKKRIATNSPSFVTQENLPAFNSETSQPTTNNNDGNQELENVENVLAENGVFALAAMTSAATFPANFKSIELRKYQIKFKTVNGSEGTIDLHTDNDAIRNVREEFQHVHVNYVNRDRSITLGDIKYSIKFSEKSAPRGGLDKIRKIGKSLSQAKFYKDVMPEKIPLRKTDISPADWRVEKYVYWERQKNVALKEIESQEEDQSGSFSGSIFDDPPDANTVVSDWKKGKKIKIAYYLNPPLVPELELDQDNIGLLSDYIEYLSEGLGFIQFNNEINRRSELRYCSYLDKAVEMYRQHTTGGSSDIISTFLSESQDNKDKAYLFKKKMVGKRLNKLIARCQLNWQIIDCVEELSVNFLTNAIQEESIDTLINEINKEYAPKFLTRSRNNEVRKLFEKAKTRLNEIKNLIAQIKSSKETNQSEQLRKEFNEFEYDIVEDERAREFMDLNEEEEEEFNNIIEDRREFLSRLEVVIENAEVAIKL
jgi:hypothetical protein